MKCPKCGSTKTHETQLHICPSDIPWKCDTCYHTWCANAEVEFPSCEVCPLDIDNPDHFNPPSNCYVARHQYPSKCPKDEWFLKCASNDKKSEDSGEEWYEHYEKDEG